MIRNCKARHAVFGVVLLVLTATPADSSTFAGLGGDCTGTTCELVMDGTMAVTATFRQSADAPASALGDSPTVTGTITNLGRAGFAGKALEFAIPSRFPQVAL